MAAAMAQVTFELDAPKSATTSSEVRVKYTLSNASPDDFNDPNFADFEVLGGPFRSTFSSMQIVNGHSSSKSGTTFTYLLRPRRSGTLTIPAATVRAGGHTYKTSAATIKITASGNNHGGKAQAHQDPFDDDDPFATSQHQQARPQATNITESSLYFTAVPTKRRVYEQEPILLSYKFYAKAGVALANLVPLQRPELNGFWTQEIPLSRTINYSTERIGGSLFRVGNCMQYVIFPQKSGHLTISPVDFSCTVVQRDPNMDDFDAFFNGGGNYSVRLKRTSPAVDLDVIPLPTPKPAGFSGGVGHFTVKAHLLTDMPKTNDVATLRITVSGNGNMKLIKTPLVTFPKDFDTYDAKMTDKTKVTADGINGDVHFDYTFVPRNIGQYDIPAVQFIYFDTTTGQYTTLKTQPIHLDVKKGDRSREDVEAEMRMRNADIADIHRGSAAPFTTSGLRGALWVGSPQYYALIVALFALFAAIIAAARRHIRRNADVVSTRGRRAHKLASKHLRVAEKALDNTDQHTFYGTLTTALRGYFADKLATDAAALTTDSIIQLLTDKGIDDELLQQVRTLLDDCDFARFAPSTDASTRRQDLDRATELLQALSSKL